VVKDESANHLVVALISAIFTFKAFSSAVKGLIFFFLGFESSA
jgi:hypothetical protein